MNEATKDWAILIVFTIMMLLVFGMAFMDGRMERRSSRKGMKDTKDYGRN